MYKLVVLSALLACAAAIPVDNGVEGDPEIECGPTSISITFNTRNNFEGHVYVKGLYDQQAAGCRTSGDGQRAVGSIELPFDSCNVARERSLEPKGVFVRTTVVINFHPRFLTKVDRAYTIQCFYMEADKTVSTEIEVSMITTGFQTQFVPMPVCRYEIRESDAPDAPIVQYALIGQSVYHTWICDTETTDTFCMVVYGCYVDDGAGDRLDLIDADGCALDRYLVGNLDYPSDLMAGKEVHVFKYADRPQLYFTCQIQITVKEPNGECARPDCAEPDGRGDGDGRPADRRQKRSADNSVGAVDVSSHFETLDISDKQTALPSELAYRAPPPRFLHEPIVLREQQSGVCMSPAALSLGLVAVLVLVAIAGALVATFVARKH